MIPEPGDPYPKVPVAETFHEKTDDELIDKEVKQMEEDDQAIQTILIGLPEDIYVSVDSCETAQEIWLPAVQNSGVQNVRNQNELIVVPRIANQNANQNEIGNVVAAWATGDLDVIEEVNANCINSRGASTLSTQTNKVAYTELLEPITDPYQVQQNDGNVISMASSMEHNGGIVKQNPATVEETHYFFESWYNNLVIEVEKV
nr:hypothetical protein [Tanacetum cinerariifolium]